jgi:Beta-lactamase
MNTKSKCIALACLLAGLSGVGWAQAEKDGALSLEVDEIVRSGMREQKIPGVALAVMRNGKIVKAAGYGLANVELNVPVTPESLFHTESVASHSGLNGDCFTVGRRDSVSLKSGQNEDRHENEIGHSTGSDL